MNEEKINELFKLFLESFAELILVDETGKIVYMNDQYAKLFDLEEPYPIGKPIKGNLPYELLSQVLSSGNDDICGYANVRNKSIITNRIVLRQGSKIAGGAAYSVFGSTISEKKLMEKIEFLQKMLQAYRQNDRLPKKPKYNIDNIITKNPKMLELVKTTERIAQTKSNVLIYGESGTGKELFAHSIHGLSYRNRGPFIVVNCAAIPENLLESELFGYAEGAFTGALKGGKKGKIEQADGGTLFLDEINSLPLSLQPKLLRAIQEHEVQKISGDSKEIDVRFVFTSNQDLHTLVQQGAFREDLYYRISVIELTIPPLRDRLEDIPLLTKHFIKKFASYLDLNISDISVEALDMLIEYDWPGNVRELSNAVERALLFCSGDILQKENFSTIQMKTTTKRAPHLKGFSIKEARENAEKTAILRALEQTGGNRNAAAKLLEIDRSILYDKMKKYAL